MAKGPGVPTTSRFIAFLTNIKHYIEKLSRLQGLLTKKQFYFIVYDIL